METAVPDVETSQHLTFRIAEEEYAVGILQVREIIQYEEVTRVPMTPQWIRGVINLRGSVVPVVDLAVKLGLAASPVTRTTCIVIVEVTLGSERTVMGVLADSVSQVIDLDPGSIEPPPPFGTRARVDYLLGMGRIGHHFALVLDIDRVLSADEVLDAVATVEAQAGDAEAEGRRDAAGGQAPPPDTEGAN